VDYRGGVKQAEAGGTEVTEEWFEFVRMLADHIEAGDIGSRAETAKLIRTLALECRWQSLWAEQGWSRYCVEMHSPPGEKSAPSEAHKSQHYSSSIQRLDDARIKRRLLERDFGMRKDPIGGLANRELQDAIAEREARRGR